MAPSAVRAWWAGVAARSPARAAKAYRLLRAILNTAVTDELLARNVCQVAGAGQERSPERPIATVVEVQALADAMPERLALLIRLAAFCGLRRGELLGLRRRDIDLLHRQVRIERSLVYISDGDVIAKAPKTSAGRRRIAIPPHLLPYLQEHLQDHTEPGADSLLFTGEKGGPLRPHVLQAKWHEARQGIGRPDLHLHDLRHSGNTWAAGTGASTAELMARMGHASPAAALATSTPQRTATGSSPRPSPPWSSRLQSCRSRRSPAMGARWARLSTRYPQPQINPETRHYQGILVRSPNGIRTRVPTLRG